MKIRNYRRALEKTIKELYGDNGYYIRIDNVNISFLEEEKSIAISGAYGKEENGKVVFEEEFELLPPFEATEDYVCGMLNQFILDKEMEKE